jgi:hypothetical protein
VFIVPTLRVGALYIYINIYIYILAGMLLDPGCVKNLHQREAGREGGPGREGERLGRRAGGRNGRREGGRKPTFPPGRVGGM